MNPLEQDLAALQNSGAGYVAAGADINEDRLTERVL
jgi:hypothetical protein